jgi:hypothetical protein
MDCGAGSRAARVCGVCPPPGLRFLAACGPPFLQSRCGFPQPVAEAVGLNDVHPAGAERKVWLAAPIDPKTTIACPRARPFWACPSPATPPCVHL